MRPLPVPGVAALTNDSTRGWGGTEGKEPQETCRTLTRALDPAGGTSGGSGEKTAQRRGQAQPRVQAGTLDEARLPVTPRGQSPPTRHPSSPTLLSPQHRKQWWVQEQPGGHCYLTLLPDSASSSWGNQSDAQNNSHPRGFHSPHGTSPTVSGPTWSCTVGPSTGQWSVH